MKRQWKLMLLALVLIVTMVAMGQSTADASPAGVESTTSVQHEFPPADHFNNLSALVCANTHPSPPPLSSWYIQYSNPYYYDANHIRYTCIGHYHQAGGVGILCQWTGIYWTGGTITGPYMDSNDCTFF